MSCKGCAARRAAIADTAVAAIERASQIAKGIVATGAGADVVAMAARFAANRRKT